MFTGKCIVCLLIMFALMIFSMYMVDFSDSKGKVELYRISWTAFIISILLLIATFAFFIKKDVDNIHEESAMIENTIKENFDNTTFNGSHHFVSNGILYEYSILEDEKVINIKSSKDNEYDVTTSINYESGKVLYDYREK